MSSPETSTRTPTTRNRWATPAVALVIGLAYLVAGWLGDNLSFGLGGLAIMVGFAAVLLLTSRRSETVAGLLDRRDERINAIDLRPTNVAGLTYIAAIVALRIRG
ncbi:MAG: hypothetical protein GEU96_19920 [Propionibacteriales bacterium]|nr:hypothetical protein [Propionibacteriales bacterium]